MPRESVWGAEEETAAQVAAECRQLATRGIRHMVFNMPIVDELTPLDTFAHEIIPAVAGLCVAGQPQDMPLSILLRE